MTSSPRRIAYIDWMRGLACVVMIETHCYDSWLSPQAKKTEFFRYSQMGGTLPAPLFLFLAGISVALVTEKLRGKEVARATVAKQLIRRGAEIFALGILFRMQEFILGIPLSPWTDLWRVDILNILGISIMLMAILCWTASGAPGAPVAVRTRSLALALIAATVVAMVTPALWTTWRPRFMPWQLETYLNGVHIFDRPQVWLFPIFPWVAFAFVGLAVGFCLFADFASQREERGFAALALVGATAFCAALASDRWGPSLYAVYDYWHTSPNFFLARSAVLVLMLCASYAWCRWGWGQVGFSPVAQLGKTSLLVYWVHIEFVYGRVSILPKGKCGIAAATLGMCVVFAAVLWLSVVRTRWKAKRVLRAEGAEKQKAERQKLQKAEEEPT